MLTGIVALDFASGVMRRAGGSAGSPGSRKSPKLAILRARAFQGQLERWSQSILSSNGITEYRLATYHGIHDPFLFELALLAIRSIDLWSSFPRPALFRLRFVPRERGRTLADG